MKLLLLNVLIMIGTTTQLYGQFWDYSNPEKLKGTVNSDAEESIPVFSKDSSILYFVRTFDKSNKGGFQDQDIWTSKVDENDEYVSCTRLSNVNNKNNNAVLGISRDGNSMYLLDSYDGKKDKAKGISIAKKTALGWGTPEKIEIPDLTIEGDFYGFHVSEDESVIIISYEGPNTIGNEDLYITTKTNSQWSSPVHLGSSVNSTGFEIAPFLSPTKDTLFFSSNGFGGEGDADIFYATKEGAWNKWSAPINLGNRINSPKFDAYFIHSGSQAFWSSNRDSELSDIYRIDILSPPLLALTISATDVTTHGGKDGKADLTITGGVKPFSIKWSNNDQNEDLNGVVKGNYTAYVKDKIGQEAEVSCVINEPPLEFEPVEASDFVNLEFLHNFAYNRNKLSVKRGDLKKFIKKIDQQLKDGRSSVTIKINSSASLVPTTAYESNEKLSELRAENMKYDIIAFFERKSDFASKVNVVIVSSVVEGPQYENDSFNKVKYTPFQFVQLKTE